MKPLKRRELVRRLRRLGWTGPRQRGKHGYMERGEATLTIPNAHNRDITIALQREIIRQAGITKSEWENA